MDIIESTLSEFITDITEQFFRIANTLDSLHNLIILLEERIKQLEDKTNELKINQKR